jgi:hypothetical protein
LLLEHTILQFTLLFIYCYCSAVQSRQKNGAFGTLYWSWNSFEFGIYFNFFVLFVVLVTFPSFYVTPFRPPSKLLSFALNFFLSR